MSKVVLNASVRENIGKSLQSLRNQGKIPAILYSKGQKGIALELASREVEVVARKHILESLILTLEVESQGAKKPHMAIIQEVQRKYTTDRILHLDFHEVSMTEEIVVSIAVEASGEAVGVKQKGGILDHVLRSIEVRGLALNMPEALQVDISHLDIGMSLHASEIKLPEGLKLATSGDVAVFAVVMPTEEAEVKPAEEEAAQQPEVIKKGKEDAEGEEGAVKPESGKAQDAKAADAKAPAKPGAKPAAKPGAKPAETKTAEKKK